MSAQTFTILHSFGQTTDGSGPFGLVLAGDTIYGVANGGGSLGYGTVFAVRTDGTGFTNLHTFAGSPTDGAKPANLVLSGNSLYGAAASGGSAGNGTLFSLQTDGTGFTNLYHFSAKNFQPFLSRQTNYDGISPAIGALSSDNVLYGTAYSGGFSGSGTVFSINTDGAGFTTLYSFSFTGFHTFPSNPDGADPNEIILAGDALYGTTEFASGGNGLTGGGGGTVFSIKTNGTSFLVLHTFSFPGNPMFPVNSDGKGSVPHNRRSWFITAKVSSIPGRTHFEMRCNPGPGHSGLGSQVLSDLDLNPVALG